MRYAIWNDFVAVNVEEVARPRDAEDVARLVERARRAGKHVKAVGASHSFNDLGLSEDILVDIGKLDRILAVDLEHRTVRVQAGIRLCVLVRALEELGLALPNIGAWTAQTIAGVLSTGTHGTSGTYRKGLLEAAIEIKLVDGLGEERVLRGEALRYLSLGYFGVITEVVLACEPLFYLRQRNAVLPGEQAIEQVEHELEEHDFVDLRWAGRVKQVITRTWDIVQGEPRPRDRAARRYEGAKLASLNRFLSLIRTPALPTRTSLLLYRTLGELYVRTGEGFENTAVWHEALTFNSLGLAAPHDERELAIPREQATDCLLALRKAMLEDPLSASFEIQVRYSAPVDVLLAPNYQRDTMWFNVNILEPARTRDLVARLSDIAFDFGARPHWCKSIPGRTPKLAKLYGPEAAPRWEAVRRSYDPQGLFLNEWYHRHLGLAGRSFPEQQERESAE